MSDNLPFEIQVEIIRRLPVKSLIRFRSVSKAWKSLINSSDFISHYSGQVQHLLVRYEDSVDCKEKFVSIVDDDTFPQQRVSFTPPPLAMMLKTCRLIGSSHGLLCFSGDSFSKVRMAVICNISIRKTVAVVVPKEEFWSVFGTVTGFGVCPETTNPKIVKIRYIDKWSNMERINCIHLQVEVFTLGTRAWRRPYRNLPRKSIKFDSEYLQVVVGGCLYFLATDRITVNGGLTSYNLIISFELTTDEFKEVKLPDSVLQQSIYSFSMSELRESLIVIEGVAEASELFFSVWMMENGVSNFFTKLFTFSVNTLNASIRGFRMSGEPIIDILEDGTWICKLFVYEPYSKRINGLGINGRLSSFCVHPYRETLLLIDQRNLKIYNKLKTLR